MCIFLMAGLVEEAVEMMLESFMTTDAQVIKKSSVFDHTDVEIRGKIGKEKRKPHCFTRKNLLERHTLGQQRSDT